MFFLFAYQAWIISRLRRCGDALVEAPTGAGKTLMIRTHVALDLGQPNGFDRVVIASPQEQIERSFLHDRETIIRWPDGVAVQPVLSIPARLFRAARHDGCGTRVAIRRYLAGGGRGHALVCTHAALTAVRASDLPADLAGCALIVDEAHHVPAEGLSRVARLWKERGGQLIFVTATPYRADNLPVSLPGMVHVRRSLAAHMSEGFAPSTLAGEIVALGHPGQRVSAAQLAGELPPPAAYTDSTVRTIVDRWERDGRPKTIVRVPPGRGLLVRQLADAFHIAGARVLDVTGMEKGRKDRFLKALDAEREVDVAGSLLDVVIGVQRVLEGTDWKHCASVYCVGIPRSLQVVVQLAGRALRKKPADYPAPHHDLARLTFFVPNAGGASLSGLSLEHSRHVLLTCAFMADHGTGQAWVVTAAVRRGLRRALAGRPEAEVDEAEAAAEPLTDPTVRAEAQLALTAARAELVEQHRKPTVIAVLERAASVRPDLPREVLVQVAVEALASQPGDAGKQVTDRLERGIATRLRVDPQVREAMKSAFSQILAEFREATLARAAGLDALGHQVHQVTGGHMAEFARRLAAAHPTPLTIDGILAWADAQHSATGAWPTSECGPIHGVADETWKGVDCALRVGHRALPGGSSLARLLHERRGVVNRLEPKQLAEEDVMELIARHHEAHGAWPTRGSGPIPGSTLTWGAVDLALIHGRHGLPGGSSIAQLLQRHEGVRNIRNLPPLTDAQVAEWAKAFEAKHGRWPTRKDGQIDGAPAGETWGRIAAALEQGLRQLEARTSLPAFLSEVCGAPEPGSVRRAMTVERILELAQDHHRRTGSWPTASTRDPVLEATGDSWSRIDRALITGGRGLPRTTLAKLLRKHQGVINANRPGPLDEATIWEWAVAHQRRTGRFPTRTSGPVHGVPGESWGALDGALKHRCRGLARGETLRQFLDRMVGGGA
ncbi:MAG: hypothetical protein M9894_09835 [Planctomycetes bacterium]|nr:hypothetical protein [Planctomycetota bacterium]